MRVALQRRPRTDPIAGASEIHFAARKDESGGGILIHRRRQELAVASRSSRERQGACLPSPARVLATCCL